MLVVNYSVRWILFGLLVSLLKPGGAQCPRPICERSAKYRTIDGSCNNLQNTILGMTGTTYVRLKNHRYSNELDGPPRSVTGERLPGVRFLSNTFFGDKNVTDSKYTIAVMQWSQLVAHDIAFTRTREGAECCTFDGQFTEIFSSDCLTIGIAENDPIYRGRACMPFTRSKTHQNPCTQSEQKLNQVEQSNSVTHFLDLSIVYGSDAHESFLLREFIGGRLTNRTINSLTFLPTTDKGCVTDPSNKVCFKAGDDRINQNPGLVALQTILLRNHNNLASGLAALHPHWNDEQLYQEARRINIAQYQHISYTEMLPILIGQAAVTDIMASPYSINVNPSIINEFTAAAFRFLHTLISGQLSLYDGNRKNEGTVRLSSSMFKIGFLTTGSNLQKVLRGITIDPMEAADLNFNKEITQFLFKFDRSLGTDMRAIDIQRGRDHGLASYNDIRESCGLQRAKRFEDFAQINANHIQMLKKAYAHPDDVDLMVGGTLERIVKDTLFGPTFLCVVKQQFRNLKVGDRFFYTSSDPSVKFTRQQMNEIQSKSSLAALICHTTRIGKIQKFAFLKNIDPKSNPLLDCTQFQKIDLNLW